MLRQFDSRRLLPIHLLCRVLCDKHVPALRHVQRRVSVIYVGDASVPVNRQLWESVDVLMSRSEGVRARCGSLQDTAPLTPTGSLGELTGTGSLGELTGVEKNGAAATAAALSYDCSRGSDPHLALNETGAPFTQRSLPVACFMTPQPC